MASNTSVAPTVKGRRRSGKCCSYGLCTSNSNANKETGLRFLPFPKPCQGFFNNLVDCLTHNQKIPSCKCLKCTKCKHWIHLCRRGDNGLRHLSDVTKYTYICNKHFVADSGPTIEHADPLPATLSPLQIAKRKMARKTPKCRDSPAVTINEFADAEVQLLQPGNELVDSAVVINEFEVQPPQPGNQLRDFQTNAKIQTELDRNATFNSGTQSDSYQIIRHDRDTQINGQTTSTVYSVESNVEFIERCRREGWAFEQTENFMTFYTTGFWEGDCHGGKRITVNVQVNVMHPLTCTVFILGRMQINTAIASEATHVSTVHELENLLLRLRKLQLCKGIAARKYIRVFERMQYDKCGQMCQLTGAVRSMTCRFTTIGIRCHECVKVLSRLRYHLRKSNASNVASRCCNNRYLSHDQLVMKTISQQEKMKLLAATNDRLVKKVKQLIANGHTVCDGDNADLLTILNKCVNEDEDRSSFHCIFIEEQKKVSARKSTNGYHWHPLMIKWCLYLQRKSASTYRALRQSEALVLPSGRTRYRYSRDFEKKVGFLECLPGEIVDRLQDLKRDQLYFSIIFDEMKIAEDLVYNRQSGELFGYVDLDNCDSIFQHQATKKEQLASHILQIMVLGLTTNICFLFAHFATGNLKTEELYNLVLRAVEVLELQFHIKVLAIVCDGAAANRSLFRIAGCSSINGVKFYMQNYFAKDEARPIYFIPDAVHLMKNVRNSFSNSGSHSKSRYLWRNGKHILWNHVIEAYRRDTPNDIRILHKITDSHVYLTSFAKMRVKYAVQVMSASMAAAINHIFHEEASETVLFIETFNKFFDILNTRHMMEGKYKRNRNLDPFWSAGDSRLKWLEDHLITYLDDWEKDVRMRPGSFNDTARKKMMLSEPTLEGAPVLGAKGTTAKGKPRQD